MIASGSEVELAVKAAEKLEGEGHAVRVVSMPSFDLFEAQPESYKEEVLPNSLRKRIAIEAGVSFGWSKYVGLDGIIVSVDDFGASAPAKDLVEKFGLTVENVLKQAESLLK